MPYTHVYRDSLALLFNIDFNNILNFEMLIFLNDN